jgi:AcrR family transcriptional regulator
MNAAIPQRSHTPKGQKGRDKVLRAAEKLLAAHGFYGTSMRDVAAAAGVPLASAVYHFARKEQLHAAVLSTIADEVEELVSAALGSEVVATAPFEARLDALLRALIAWAASRPARVRLLLRELLDNPTRVARAARLPLAPLLRKMTEFVSDGMAAGSLTAGAPEIAVLGVVGAISYFVAAKPTLDRIVGERRGRALSDAYAQQALEFARRALGAGTSTTQESHHGSDHADRPRPARARAPRKSNDGPRRRADVAPGSRVR